MHSGYSQKIRKNLFFKHFLFNGFFARRAYFLDNCDPLLACDKNTNVHIHNETLEMFNCKLALFPLLQAGKKLASRCELSPSYPGAGFPALHPHHAACSIAGTILLYRCNTLRSESLKAVATAANGGGTFWTKIHAILSDLFICCKSCMFNSILKCKKLNFITRTNKLNSTVVQKHKKEVPRKPWF